MKCSCKLPVFFDHVRLKQEFSIIRLEWTKHFNVTYYSGEWSGIPLRSPKIKSHVLSAGDSSSNEFVNEQILEQIPYTKGLLDSLLTEKLSVRYLRLTPGSKIKPHQDYDMVFWDGYVRLHVPIITNDGVEFSVAGECLDMKPGELWFADFSRTHYVINRGETDRVHLVIDCRVNNWLVALFEEVGILERDEQKPDPMDQYTDEAKKQVIGSLLAMDTDTSKERARHIAEKYGLPLEF